MKRQEALNSGNRMKNGGKNETEDNSRCKLYLSTGGEGANSKSSSVWAAAYLGNVCSKYCSDFYCGGSLWPFCKAERHVNPECNDYCRDWNADSAVSHLEGWFRTSYCNGNQFYICFSFLLFRPGLWI